MDFFYYASCLVCVYVCVWTMGIIEVKFYENKIIFPSYKPNLMINVSPSYYFRSRQEFYVSVYAA